MMTMPVIFSHTVQQTMEWLDELRVLLGVGDERSAYAALRGVLHQLRDRLTVEEATDLGAQLPLLVRGIYYENYNPSKTPEKIRHLDAFLGELSAKLKGHEELDPETAARAVFALLEAKITPGEIDDVVSAMPSELRKLWPESAQTRAAAKQG